VDILHINLHSHWHPNKATQKTRSPVVARIADRTGCQRLSRSSKSDDFHFISKGICHFLSV